MNGVQGAVDQALGPPLLLRVEQAANKLGLSRSTTYELIRTGQLESVKVGRCRRVALSAVERFAAGLNAA